jgi:hypothetical protein
MLKNLRLAVVVLLASCGLAQGQIGPTSPARQRAANRQALREARHAEVPYKESHLDVQPQQLKRGSSEAPKAVAGEPRFGHDGAPHVATRKFPGMRRKPKNEPTP